MFWHRLSVIKVRIWLQNIVSSSFITKSETKLVVSFKVFQIKLTVNPAMLRENFVICLNCHVESKILMAFGLVMVQDGFAVWRVFQRFY